MTLYCNFFSFWAIFNILIYFLWVCWKVIRVVSVTEVFSHYYFPWASTRRSPNVVTERASGKPVVLLILANDGHWRGNVYVIFLLVDIVLCFFSTSQCAVFTNNSAGMLMLMLTTNNIGCSSSAHAHRRCCKCLHLSVEILSDSPLNNKINTTKKLQP